VSAVPAAEAEGNTALQPPAAGSAAALRAAVRPWLIVHVVAATGALGEFVLVWFLMEVQVVLGLFGVRRWQNLVARLAPVGLVVGIGLWVAAMVLGAVWANTALGRAWGWDPKEICAVGTLAISLVWFALARWLRTRPFLWSATAALLCWLLVDIWWGTLAQTHSQGYWLSATSRCNLYGALLNVVLLGSAWWAERNRLPRIW
jgi:ABC-type transport system involved in cytochrome c biogenesis permease subunit